MNDDGGDDLVLHVHDAGDDDDYVPLVGHVDDCDDDDYVPAGCHGDDCDDVPCLQDEEPMSFCGSNDHFLLQLLR